MVWPIMGDARRRSIHLKDGVEASQRLRSSGRSAPSSTLGFKEQSGNCSGTGVGLGKRAAAKLLIQPKVPRSDAKTTIEAVRVLSWHACRALDKAAPGALELAIHAKVFGSEAAVRVVANLTQVVGVDSYGHELPLAGLLQDAMALALFAGGNIGVRRRQLHALMLDPGYDDLATLDGVCLAQTVS